jgi:hypothetical protein
MCRLLLAFELSSDPLLLALVLPAGCHLRQPGLKDFTVSQCAIAFITCVLSSQKMPCCCLFMQGATFTGSGPAAMAHSTLLTANALLSSAMQGAAFTSQAYDAVAASTASGTGSSSSREVPHVVLLLCHALLQRGEESEAQLTAAVRCLVASRHAKMLPVMLAGAMADLFRPAEFSRCA